MQKISKDLGGLDGFHQLQPPDSNRFIADRSMQHGPVKAEQIEELPMPIHWQDGLEP